ncbi:Interactor protein for cytohesin exchange factors 1 [Dissostichus eleginoides]|uniref:Interactor protein for cytohesin exchange factors 1 n=1 Tax=Dissostichus eleginoides TaxID=100907 RepID=A0AAD9BVT1_DISEL|nr:Interactor protein for cytohesin exchange factors 1 [Dissostichus eleginoides]
MSRRRVSVRDLGLTDCQGWLLRRKEARSFLGARWKRYWFVLKKSSLYWYSNKMAEKAEGFIYLPGFTIQKAQQCKKKHSMTASHPLVEAAESDNRGGGGTSEQKGKKKNPPPDEMELLYRRLQAARLSPIGQSSQKDFRASFIRRCPDDKINEELHLLRILSSTMKAKQSELQTLDQVLNDPALAAPTYRKWKLCNFLLLQEIRLKLLLLSVRTSRFIRGKTFQRHQLDYLPSISPRFARKWKRKNRLFSERCFFQDSICRECELKLSFDEQKASPFLLDVVHLRRLPPAWMSSQIAEETHKKMSTDNFPPPPLAPPLASPRLFPHPAAPPTPSPSPSPPTTLCTQHSNSSQSARSPSVSRGSSIHGVSFLLQIGLTRESVTFDPADQSLSAVRELVCSIVDKKLLPQRRISRSDLTLSTFTPTKLRLSVTTVEKCCGDSSGRASSVKDVD